MQIVKEPLGNKGPKVTTHITLPGNFMVLKPFSKSINVSKKNSRQGRNPKTKIHRERYANR